MMYLIYVAIRNSMSPILLAKTFAVGIFLILVSHRLRTALQLWSCPLDYIAGNPILGPLVSMYEVSLRFMNPAYGRL